MHSPSKSPSLNLLEPPRTLKEYVLETISLQTYGYAGTCIIQLVRNPLLLNLIDTSRKTQEIYFAHKMCTKTSYYSHYYGGQIVFSPSTHGYQFVWEQSKPSLNNPYLIQMLFVMSE